MSEVSVLMDLNYALELEVFGEQKHSGSVQSEQLMHLAAALGMSLSEGSGTAGQGF